MGEVGRCRGCAGQLSRYNPEPYCAACSSERAAGRHVVPLWLWDSAQLREAFAKVELGSALAVIRISAGLSQLELAAILGWSQSQVARVESGQRDTLYDVRRLFDVADALDMPRTVLIPMILGELAPTQIETGEEDAMSLTRRELGGTLAGLAAAAGLSQVQIPVKVDSAHIRYFVASAERLYAKDQQVGGGALARDGLRLYHRARRMLDEAHYTDDIGRQLMAAAGDLAVCVGWLCYDADDHHTARALYSEARLLADQSGDDGLAVQAMQQSAHLLVRTSRDGGGPGQAREAVRLAQRAGELAKYTATPPLHALLSAREAVAHAALGDSREFDRAITRAQREIDRGHETDIPTWLRFVNRSEILIQEAYGRRTLGDARSAVDMSRASLDNPLLSPRNTASYRASLATALVDHGDVTGGMAEAATVLSFMESGDVSSPRTLSKLREVRRVAGTHQKGKEFCARFDMAASVTS